MANTGPNSRRLNTQLDAAPTVELTLFGDSGGLTDNAEWSPTIVQRNLPGVRMTPGHIAV
jgi:hypothetical protein